jgi:hypothetical protein
MYALRLASPAALSNAAMFSGLVLRPLAVLGFSGKTAFCFLDKTEHTSDSFCKNGDGLAD